MHRPSRLPAALFTAIRRWDIAPTAHILAVSVQTQSLAWWAPPHATPSPLPIPAPPSACARSLIRVFSRPLGHTLHRLCRISTSRFGVGQVENSLRTPLGLHRVARKIGHGCLIGTVFKHRQPIGWTWDGLPEGPITQRILWLEGLEPGWNRDGQVDTFQRYIYIHGFSDESTLGKPKSSGCIHMAASDLIPLFDLLPQGSLVWIGEL